MPIESAEDVKALALQLLVQNDRLTTAEKTKVADSIVSHSSRLGVSIDLANAESAQGETGKTRAQPRQYGGRFGVKGFGGNETPQYTPSQISEAIDNLRPGQSINLPNGKGKVKRLANGFQIVTPNGSTNVVVKTAQMAASKANSMVGTSTSTATKEVKK